MHRLLACASEGRSRAPEIIPHTEWAVTNATGESLCVAYRNLEYPCNPEDMNDYGDDREEIVDSSFFLFGDGNARLQIYDAVIHHTWDGAPDLAIEEEELHSTSETETDDG